MKTEFKFSYPSSEKVYLSGRLYPELKVGMRKVHLLLLLLSRKEKDVRKTMLLCIYMIPVVPYSDPNIDIKLRVRTA